jgi:signal transduction histidine kinase
VQQRRPRWWVGTTLVAGALLTLAPPTSAQDGSQPRAPSGALILVVVQTAIIAGLLVYGARRRRAEHHVRDHNRVLQARHDRISRLLGRLIAAHDHKRERLARDLQDDVSQRIAALSIAMSGLKRKLAAPVDQDSAMVALHAMQRETTALAEQVRHLSHDLHPGLLQQTGLVPALDGLCATFGKRHSITVTCGAIPELEPVDCETALCLYRVTQEVLHNAGQHAQAQRVDLRLTRTADGIQLSIADDGKGFDLASTRGCANGLGLVSIDERVRMLRGTVDIETKPGAGTLVIIRIPTPDVIGPVAAAALPA